MEGSLLLLILGHAAKSSGMLCAELIELLKVRGVGRSFVVLHRIEKLFLFEISIVNCLVQLLSELFHLSLQG